MHLPYLYTLKTSDSKQWSVQAETSLSQPSKQLLTYKQYSKNELMFIRVFGLTTPETTYLPIKVLQNSDGQDSLQYLREQVVLRLKGLFIFKDVLKLCP